MKTLVTGATGFIGRRLMQQDYRALVRNPAGFKHEVVGDLLDRSSLQNACNGIEVVFHCAGYAHASSTGPADIQHDVNFIGVKNLIEVAGQAGVKSFILLSSVKAMAEPGENCVNEDWPGKPLSHYGQAKRAAEDIVLDLGAQYGMHVVNLRLAMVYGSGGHGNMDRMVRVIRTGWFPALPETGNKRSLIHVQDVIDVMHLVAEKPQANGKTYIVAEPKAYSGREIYQTIRTALGMSSDPAFTIPIGLLRSVGRLSIQLSEVVDRLISSAYYSPAKLESELGWRAQISLADGLKEMLSIRGGKQ
jgi:nucleoside-diphosphate-sugar epimerase